MFNDEELIAFNRMHDFSTVDGFLEITENMADMIKYIANEPSAGLFFIQQHARDAAPNVINLKNSVNGKSHETALHTEDLEDSITMVRSMKEHGFPIADEMIRDIKKSLSIMSIKQPKRGLVHNSSSGFLGRTSSWSPATWGRNRANSQSDGEKSTSYLSSVFQRAYNFKGLQVGSKQPSHSKGEKLLFNLSPEFPSAVDNGSLNIPEAETEDLPLSSELGNELQEESQLSKSSSHQQIISLYENYEEFKADQHAKLEEWLEGTGNGNDFQGERFNRGALAQQDFHP